MLRLFFPRPGHAASRLLRFIRVPRHHSHAALAFVSCLACGSASLLPRDAVAEIASSAPPRIAGVLADPGDTIDRWCWSGAWVYPVGDPRALGEPERPGDAGYRILRSVQRGRHHVSHQGADLGNRSGGGTVRVAASGLVVRATRSQSNGYGEHIVVAHRLDDGGLVYSVYAHLIPGSIAVREGDIVPAGQPIGRVGRSGRASTEHLHFEIRRPRSPELRWENAAVEDPLVFIGKRLTSSPDSASWATPYLAWAEASALIEHNAATAAPLERSTWWSMLARAARHSLHDLPADVDLARRLLMELGVLGAPDDSGELADHEDADRGRPVEWSELHRDLERLADVGIRLPACLAFGKAANRESARPGGGTERSKTPTVGDACFELAELATPSGAPRLAPGR